MIPGDNLLHCPVKAVVPDNRRGFASAGVDAMKCHDVDGAGNLFRVALHKGVKDVQLLLFGGVHELIRHTAAVFHFDGNDFHRRGRGSAGGLLSALGHDIDFIIQGEYKNVVSRKRDGNLPGELRQGRVAADLAENAGNHLRREIGAHCDCHSLSSFHVQILQHVPQRRALGVLLRRFRGRQRCRGRFGDIAGKRLRVFPHLVLRSAGQAFRQLVGDLVLVGDL